MNTIFGPVPSRRLGRSLGIDVLPSKTCSYDCIYCESGRTTHLTIKRQAHVSPGQVIDELCDFFLKYPRGADVITFAGAGEPTLYEPLGELLRSIKKRFRSIPLIVLTNGSLLWDSKVRRDLLSADRVVPSLDSVTEDIYRKLNRPHPCLELRSIIEGLRAFRKEYRGELHIELVLAKGYNDSAQELNRISDLLQTLAPDQVELNTVVRPPADSDVKGLSGQEMKKVLSFFPELRTCIIGEFRTVCNKGDESNLQERVMDLVRRRPCTVSEMAISLGVAVETLQVELTKLNDAHRVVLYSFNELEFVREQEE